MTRGPVRLEECCDSANGNDALERGIVGVMRERAGHLRKAAAAGTLEIARGLLHLEFAVREARKARSLDPLVVAAGSERSSGRRRRSAGNE